MIGRSDWVVVAPPASVKVTVGMTAEPGADKARLATNVGSNVHDDIVTFDLGAIDHP